MQTGPSSSARRRDFPQVRGDSPPKIGDREDGSEKYLQRTPGLHCENISRSPTSKGRVEGLGELGEIPIEPTGIKRYRDIMKAFMPPTLMT